MLFGNPTNTGLHIAIVNIRVNYSEVTIEGFPTKGGLVTKIPGES